MIRRNSLAEGQYRLMGAAVLGHSASRPRTRIRARLPSGIEVSRTGEAHRTGPPLSARLPAARVGRTAGWLHCGLPVHHATHRHGRLPRLLLRRLDTAQGTVERRRLAWFTDAGPAPRLRQPHGRWRSVAGSGPGFRPIGSWHVVTNPGLTGSRCRGTTQLVSGLDRSLRCRLGTGLSTLGALFVRQVLDLVTHARAGHRTGSHTLW